MNSEKVISNIKKAIKEHLDNNYAYDMLVDFELDVIDWNSLFEYIDKLQQVQQENQKLKENWNKLKEYIRKNIIYDDVGMKILDPSSLEDYIQELEQGSDNE